MTSAFLVVLVLSGLLGGMVNVRVVPPLRMLERKAGMLVMPAGAETVEWQIRCDEAGPFPSHFEPSSIVLANSELDRLTEVLSHPKSRYQLIMREFPKEQAAVYPPAAVKGERVFPERIKRDERFPDAEGTLEPHLQILAHLPGDVEPKLPAFYPKEVSPAAAALTWKFVVRVSESGRVSDCMPTGGGEGEGTASGEVENWVRSVRFGSRAAEFGWFGIEVRFSRRP